MALYSSTAAQATTRGRGGSNWVHGSGGGGWGQVVLLVVLLLLGPFCIHSLIAGALIYVASEERRPRR